MIDFINYKLFMYPFIEPINWFLLYTFGFSLVVCFFLFFWMLKKLWEKYSFDTSIFTNNILWYFLSVFFFSRLFYIIGQWNDLKYIDSSLEFFIMSDYNFSLYWALIWFFIVLYINLKLRKEKLEKYIDGVVLSFLFVLVVWYIWSLLWGQVYWKPTDFWIEFTYNHPFTSVPSWNLFPLPIVYTIVSFIIFSSLYILSLFIKIRWFIGYIWLLMFAIMLLIFESYTWRFDIFKVNFGINMTQILSLFLIMFSFYKLYIVSKVAWEDTTILINKI